jgi:hypothetical protein
VRRPLARIAFAALALASIVPTIGFLRAQPPSLDWPDYAEYLSAVAAHTAKGDSIALLVPARGNTNDYEYAYFRASYLLPGREILPVVVKGRLIPENVQRARYVAMWRGRIALGRPVVWRGHHGELLGRE